MYTFYFPIEVGDFIVSAWSRSTTTTDASGIQYEGGNGNYSVTIYDRWNGGNVKKDARLGRFCWNAKLFHSWKEETFTKKELHEILVDLYHLADAPSSPSPRQVHRQQQLQRKKSLSISEGTPKKMTDQGSSHTQHWWQLLWT